MTANTSVFGDAELFDIERENSDAEDRGEELAERFAYLPRSCIQDVYENLCQRNFDWTVDYLSGLEQEQIDLYANDKDSAGVGPVQDKSGFTILHRYSFPMYILHWLTALFHKQK